MVPYMDAVVVVTLMRVLLFVLHVCMLSGAWTSVWRGGGVMSV